MTKEIIIILLLIALFYLYQQNKQLKKWPLTQETLFSFEHEQLQEQKKDLQTRLDQALALQEANQGKLERLTQELDLILNKWNWEDWKPSNAQEFINKFEPWINKRFEQERELKSELERLKSERSPSAELEDLESELDQERKRRQEEEQENTALINRLKGVKQELSRQGKELETLKDQKVKGEITFNKTIKELKAKSASTEQELVQLKGELTNSRSNLDKLQEKYSKQGKLLDEEQLENEKLEEGKERLEAQIEELKRSKSPIESEELEEELEKDFQEKLRKINLLFDEKAQGYKEIDFEGLYSLLSGVARERERERERAKVEPPAIFSRQRKEAKPNQWSKNKK